MESPSIPQEEREEEPGPRNGGNEPPAETGADEVPPSDSLDHEDAGENDAQERGANRDQLPA